MVKTRVHDLAAEFGIPSEQLMGLLKDMDIFVRSHMSALENDQVAAVRVRWEREKRKTAEDAAPKKGRRKAAKAAEPPPPPVEARPARRRRTAAEVAQAEAVAQAERDAEISALELELGRPAPEIVEQPTAKSIEERARALFKDLPPAPVEEEAAETEAPAVPAAAAPASSAPAAPVAPPPAPPSTPTRAPFIPPRIPRSPPPGRGPRPRSAAATAPASRRSSP